MSVAPPTRQDAGVGVIALDECHSRLSILTEVGAVGVVAAHLVGGVGTVLVVVAAVEGQDTRVVRTTLKLVLATAAAELVRLVAAVVDVVAALVLADTPGVRAVEVAGGANTRP